jgi:aspartyl protease family protein
MLSLQRAHRHFHCIAIAAIGLLLAAVALRAAAADISLIGVMPGKAAVLAIDGGNPKVVRIGRTWSGVRVITVEKQHAIVEIDGTRSRLPLGQHHRAGGATRTDRQQVVLAADPRGHFIIQGGVNGGSVRFLLDTGATAIALPRADAERLGIAYREGSQGTIETANGRTTAWRIKLDTVKIGAIELRNVDAVVLESGLEIALLGMTFLNRVEMKRDGSMMTLTRRY